MFHFYIGSDSPTILFAGENGGVRCFPFYTCFNYWPFLLRFVSALQNHIPWTNQKARQMSSFTLIMRYSRPNSNWIFPDLISQLFRYVEQAEWATEVMKATGKPVAVCLSVSLAGDMNGVLPGECAVRVARAGTWVLGTRAFFLRATGCFGLLDRHDRNRKPRMKSL